MLEALSVKQSFDIHMPAANDLAPISRALLSPGQERIYQRLVNAVSAAPIVKIQGGYGTGKSTLARLIAQDSNGIYLTLEDILQEARMSEPRDCGNAVITAIEAAFDRSDVVVLDGGQLFASYAPANMSLEVIRAVSSCRGRATTISDVSMRRPTGSMSSRRRLRSLRITGPS
jgi:hypothetical protein